MKSFVVAAAAAMIGAASAQNAIVKNNCDATFYVQSFPFGSDAPGPLVAVDPKQSFSEALRNTGSTIKISWTKNLDSPLFFGYSSSSNPDTVYYELSSEWAGDTFINNHNTLGAGAGCQVFDCQPHDANCYSTPASKKVPGCPAPVDLTAQIC
ncbi:hypothetical protein E4U21_006218 [Claviceps maximensis]|nr:hypothetical protein E4U21_006218 [Claviceps maximensis]